MVVNEVFVLESGKSLRQESESIIKELDILDLLNSFGDARVVGSVALDLVVKRDIDIHVFLILNELSEATKDIVTFLLDRPKIREVRITDYRDSDSIKVAVDDYPGKTGTWSIDIWLTTDMATTGFKHVEVLKQKMTPEHREVILKIKHFFHDMGALRDGLSLKIYESVIEDGVRSVEEFDDFY